MITYVGSRAAQDYLSISFCRHAALFGDGARAPRPDRTRAGEPTGSRSAFSSAVEISASGMGREHSPREHNCSGAAGAPAPRAGRATRGALHPREYLRLDPRVTRLAGAVAGAGCMESIRHGLHWSPYRRGWRAAGGKLTFLKTRRWFSKVMPIRS